MKINYEIMQLPVKHICCFRDETVAPLADYHKIYSGTIEPLHTDNRDILEDLFYLLNVNPPEDYLGRSLSTSDIVIINGTKYLCLFVGWKELSEVE